MTTSTAESSRPLRSMHAFLFISGSRAVLLGCWFWTTRFLANVLGPAGFGLYFPCQTAIRVLTGCIGDPLDMAVMREAPLLLRDNRAGALDLIRSAFWLRVSIATLLLLMATCLPKLASRAIFASPELRGLAVMTVAGVLGDFLLRSALGYFQVSRLLNRFLATDAVWQLSRVIVVVALAHLRKLDATNAIALYVFAPYVAFLVAWPLLPHDVRRLSPPHMGHVISIVSYSGWIVIGLVMAAAYERLDVLVLLRCRGKVDVGVYGGAVFLASIPDFIDGIIQTSIAPRVAPAFADGSFNALQKNYFKYSIPLGIIGGACAVIFSNWGIQKFFSTAYAGCVPAFRILVISTLFNLVFTPLAAALVSYVAPRRIVTYTAVGLIIVTIGSVALIPRYGSTGAACTMLTARLIVGLLIIGESIRLTQQRSAENKEQSRVGELA